MGSTVRLKYGIATCIIGLIVFIAAFWLIASRPTLNVVVPTAPAALRIAPGSGTSVPVNLVSGDWGTLSLAQRNVLLPLKANWGALDSRRRQKWAGIADRYCAMSADARLRVQSRMRAWVKLKPEQRIAARENYVRNRNIGSNTKSVQWQKYQHLPAAQREQLGAHARGDKQESIVPLIIQQGEQVELPHQAEFENEIISPTTLTN